MEVPSGCSTGPLGGVITLGRLEGIPVGAVVGTAPGARVSDEVARMVSGSHMDVAESVPVG